MGRIELLGPARSPGSRSWSGSRDNAVCRFGAVLRTLGLRPLRLLFQTHPAQCPN
jgi:hypothetical protein